MNFVIILAYVLVNLVWAVFLYDELCWYHTFVFRDMFFERTKFEQFQIVILGILCLPAIIISGILYVLFGMGRKRLPVSKEN